MSGLMIRPYRRGDFDKITARADFAALGRDDGFGQAGPDAEASWTLVADRSAHGGDGKYGVVLGCGGFVQERSGVFGLWGYCGDGMGRREWVAVARQARALIGELMASGAHRVHAMARADHDEAVAFLMHVGLRSDVNRLVAIGPDGEDFMLLAAIAGIEA